MVSLRVGDSKVGLLRIAIQFEYYDIFLIKVQNNGECNVRNFRQFLFGSVLM